MGFPLCGAWAPNTGQGRAGAADTGQNSPWHSPIHEHQCQFLLVSAGSHLEPSSSPRQSPLRLQLPPHLTLLHTQTAGSSEGLSPRATRLGLDTVTQCTAGLRRVWGWEKYLHPAHNLLTRMGILSTKTAAAAIQLPNVQQAPGHHACHLRITSWHNLQSTANTSILKMEK